MLALNERAIQRPDFLSSTIITGVIGIQREYPAKWVYDVEIEKLKADFFLKHVEKTKIMLGCLPCPLMKRLRTTFQAMIF